MGVRFNVGAKKVTNTSPRVTVLIDITKVTGHIVQSGYLIKHLES